jgi:CDP-glucose 4,6-dehydratase
VEVDTSTSAAHEATLLRLDITLAHTLLEWSPVLSLEETVGMTAQFYSALIENPDSCRKLLETDIATYRGKLSNGSLP